MFSLKEILILVFTLIGCLVIFLYAPNQLAVEHDTADYPKAKVQYRPSVEISNRGIWVSSETKDRLSNQTKYLSQSEDETGTVPVTAFSSKKTVTGTAPSSVPSDTEIINNKTALSLKDVLAEVENLSAELKLEFLEFEEYQPESCSSCGPVEDPGLEKYLSSIGYSSWEEYSSSEQYRLAKAEFLTNKESILKENPPENICATVLAQQGGGGGGGGGGGQSCDCDNADGACYTDTSSGRYYHCMGSCCCACCNMCCF